MSCILSTGYSVPCLAQAGIRQVYISQYNGNALAYTFGTASGNLNQITAFTGATQTFYTFDQNIETGSLVNTANINVQNGSAFWEMALEFTINVTDQTNNDIVQELTTGRYRAMVVDLYGNYFLLGLVNPVNTTAVAAGLGKAGSDINGYVITMTSKEATPATQVTTAAALSVIQP